MLWEHVFATGKKIIQCTDVDLDLTVIESGFDENIISDDYSHY